MSESIYVLILNNYSVWFTIKGPPTSRTNQRAPPTV